VSHYEKNFHVTLAVDVASSISLEHFSQQTLEQLIHDWLNDVHQDSPAVISSIRVIPYKKQRSIEARLDDIELKLNHLLKIDSEE
jgi:hypothetical protein